MTQVVDAAIVRDYLGVDSNAGQYNATSMDNNILAAQDYLEHRTGRWFIDRPTTTFTTTTNGRAQVYIPGFRTITGVSFAGSALTIDSTAWKIPDPLGTGIYVALQLRPFTAHGRNDGPWWLYLGGATTNWFDTNADSPYDPRNYGGSGESSIPNDLVVSGDGGYTTATLPSMFIHAVTVLAAFYTQRPAAILADVAITPSGGVLNYAALPSEVNEFIRVWSIGETAVSV